MKCKKNEYLTFQNKVKIRLNFIYLDDTEVSAMHRQSPTGRDIYVIP